MALKPELWYLRQVDLLSALPEATLADIRQASAVRTIKRRQSISIDSADGEVHVISEGLAKLCRTSQSGNKVVETVLRDGDVFGRLLLDGPRQICTIEAISDTTVLAMSRAAMSAAMKANPDLALEVIQILEDRQRRLGRQVESLLYKDVFARVIETLLHIAKAEPDRCTHGWAVDVRITQQDLAELIGASRQAVNRVLRSLEDRRFVHRSGRLLCIRDLQALSRLVE